MRQYRMRFFPALLAASLAFAQSAMPVEKLIEFVRSSIQLKLPDKQVAAQLHAIHVSQKLEESKVEMLQGEGAGPKTIAALREMSSGSQSLAAAPPPASPVVRKSLPPPSYEDQQKVINAMREYSLNYSGSLPDFVCKQVTRRYLDPLGHENWRSSDVLVSKLSYAEQKEHYEVILANGQAVLNRGIESFGGTTSTGEFGSLLKYIFDPKSDAEFHWDRWGRVRGHVTHVFSFMVDQAHSKWGIFDGESKQEVVPAYNGFVFVDRDTSQVLRVFMQSIDIPSSFPIQLAQTQLDYDYTDLSGRQFLLPYKAEIRLNRGRFMTKNDVEFRSYQKFSADAVITFDTPEPLPDEKAAPPPPPHQ